MATAMQTRVSDPELYRLARRFRQMAAEVAGRDRSLDIHAVLLGMLRLLRMIVPFDGLVVAGADRTLEETYWIRLAAFGQEIRYYPEPQIPPRGRGGFLSELIRQGEPLVLDHSAWQEEAEPLVPWLDRMRSALVVPTVDLEGRDVVQVFFQRREQAFESDDLRQAVVMGNLFGALMQNIILRQGAETTRDQLDGELAHVGQIQRKLLPAALPQLPGWELTVHYATSARCGGDAYDFLRRPNGAWGLWLSDASGHGAAAAVVMAMTRVALRDGGERAGGLEGPAALLERVSGVLAHHLPDDQFVTAWTGILDPTSGQLEVGTAGHPTPRVRRAKRGRVEPLPEGDGLPLGLLSTGGATSAATGLAPGDVLVVYTDGVTEASNRRGELFGVRRLDRALALSAANSTEAICDSLVARLAAFRGRRPLDDDATLLVLKRISH